MSTPQILHAHTLCVHACGRIAGVSGAPRHRQHIAGRPVCQQHALDVCPRAPTLPEKGRHTAKLGFFYIF
jgi:hypothetical protein